MHVSNLVCIYDSVFDQLDDESLLLVKTMFSSSSSGTMEIHMANMQKQRGGDECGVFVSIWRRQICTRKIKISFITML